MKKIKEYRLGIAVLLLVLPLVAILLGNVGVPQLIILAVLWIVAVALVAWHVVDHVRQGRQPLHPGDGG
ncbi:hypothetical protein CLV30_11814 [Haloactinopolyspora alba]|uniref:Uncharacterized protein n=1 Tax=Haloactinopolyspora alba TaxID=648780 RepID=A0A2P8DPJ1_9ACTN|nr:hypothetical protein [Haloactinopolyspora alba]PSK99113.1 hypothetical protein CLV30_11814 [Haloactinopolyspora alba]